MEKEMNGMICCLKKVGMLAVIRGPFISVKYNTAILLLFLSDFSTIYNTGSGRKKDVALFSF